MRLNAKVIFLLILDLLIKTQTPHILLLPIPQTHSHTLNSPVTGPVARFCRQIAGQGYIVAAPSSYHEFTGPEPLAYVTRYTTAA